MSCETACFETSIECCRDIIIKAGLTPSTAYYWVISKATSANVWQRLANTDSDGNLTILKTSLPSGFLIKGNKYKIILKNGADYLQPVNFNFGGKQYGCVMVELVDINRLESDSSEVNIIQYKNPV